MRINILLCDTFPGRLPDYIPSYESLFFDLFDTVGLHPDYRIYQTWQGELPVEINRDELYLIPGSLASAYDDEPWIVALVQWIKQAYASGAKLMGVCFGHQAIARALGGEVRPYPGGVGVGIRSSCVLDEPMQQFFKGSQMSLLYSHYDQVSTLPADAVLCATSDFCKIESYRIGHQVVTFQGHPEFTVAYSRHLLTNCSDDLDESVRQAALKSFDLLEPQGSQAAQFAMNLLFGSNS